MNIFRCVFSNQTTSNYSVYIALQESRDFIKGWELGLDNDTKIFL